MSCGILTSFCSIRLGSNATRGSSNPRLLVACAVLIDLKIMVVQSRFVQVGVCWPFVSCCMPGVVCGRLCNRFAFGR